MRLVFRASVLVAVGLLLGGCGKNDQAANNDDLKKSLDQIAQTTKDIAGQVKEIGTQSKGSADALRTLTERIDDLHKDLSTALARQKRGALALTLDVETVCDNDAQCANTARAVCNKINYPNAITTRFTPGVRPVLNSLVCFD